MPADPRTMNVSCPHCGARYLLPANLLGPGGARVRCPGCSRSFDVAPPERVSPPPPAASAAHTPAAPVLPAAPEAARTQPAAPAPPRRPTPAELRADGPVAAAAQAIAREVLGALKQEGGPSLSDAVAQGSLFAKHGPAIFAAFDEYRRRVPLGGAGPFRTVLREMWGVELPEVTPRP